MFVIKKGTLTFLQNQLVWLLTLIPLYFIVGDILFAPNQFMYSIGGDPLVIYYDVLYYVKYGVDARLNGMNYPHGELIFLTDAQGALSVLLRWIQVHLFQVSDYVIGIIHFMNILAILVCSVIVQKILEAFELKKSWAIIFAIFITILSPQIMRVGGHFGLAYPFIIPLSILFFIRKYRLKKMEWRDLIYLATLLFFTFNNPYVGLSSAFFILLCSFFILFFRPSNKNIAAYLFLIGSLIIVIPFLYFHFADAVTDRVKLQWGYFAFSSDYKGFFISPGSLIEIILRHVHGPVQEIGFEAQLNIGLVSTVFIVLFLVSFFVKKRLHIPASLKIILLAAFCIFLYTSASLNLFLDKDVIEEKLGFLLMFKAVARIAWVCYFALTIFAVVVMDKLWKRPWNIHIKNGLFIIILMLWATEFYTYRVASNNGQPQLFRNEFSVSVQQEVVEQLQANQINIADYQACLWIPRVQLWTDIFSCDPNFFAHFYGLQLSVSTGLPSISSMLSRISIGQTAEATELLASPLVYKSLVDKLPNKKDILLVAGRSDKPYTLGEQFMISQATLVLKQADYALYRLALDKINDNEFRRKAKAAFAKNEDAVIENIHFGYNNQPSAVSYFGGGAKSIRKYKEYVLIDTVLPAGFTSDTIVLSGWTHFDALKHGLGDYRIKLRKKNGETSEPWIDARNTNEIHDDWIRWDLVVPSEPGMQVLLLFQSEKDTWVDEIDIKNGRADYLLRQDGNSTNFLYNNYKIFLP